MNKLFADCCARADSADAFLQNKVDQHLVLLWNLFFSRDNCDLPVHRPAGWGRTTLALAFKKA
jgi:hypothetical protein